MTTIDGNAIEAPFALPEHSMPKWKQQFTWRKIQSRRAWDRVNIKAGLRTVKEVSKRFLRRHRRIFSFFMFMVCYVLGYLISYYLALWLLSISPWLYLAYLISIIVLAVWLIARI